MWLHIKAAMLSDHIYKVLFLFKPILFFLKTSLKYVRKGAIN